jgi:hypothetical protein
MFSVNQLYSNKDNTIRVRVCHVAIELAKLAVVDINRLESDKPICKPKGYDFEEFAKYIKKNQLTASIKMLPETLNLSDKKLLAQGKSSWLKKRDKKVEAVLVLLNEDTVREYLYGKGIGELAHQLIADGGPWKKTSNYYRQFNRYITFGGVINAFLPFDYANCGSNYFIPEEQGSNNVKRGRKTKPKRLPEHKDIPVYSVAPGITKKEKKEIKKVAKKAVSKIRKNITAKARLIYRRENETKFVDEETQYGTNKKLIWNKEEECLSEGQFYYHFNKYLTDEDKIKAVKGQTVFDKDFAERDDAARSGLVGPTHLYEIDATVLDIHVRYPYSKNKRLSMGRPILYVVVDVYSTCIVGIYIGFHGPDWAGAAEALINSMMDKVSFAARYGLKINQADWPCSHIPFSINSDNGGEYSLAHIHPLLKSNLGIDEWTKTRSYMGVSKSVSERKFGIFNDNFVHFQPGAIYEVRRDEQDPSQDALWDLDSLYCAIISEVIYYNHTGNREEHHDFKGSRAEIGFSPQAIWDFYINEEMAGGNPTTAEDEGRIRLACLPEAEATVTDQGVKFQGVYYTSVYAKTAKWYFKAKNFGFFHITVKWSRTSSNIIWYQTPDNEVISFKIKPLKSKRFSSQVWESIFHRQEVYARQQHEAKREKAERELQKDDCQREILAKNRAEIEGLPENTTKSHQGGIKDRKDEQSTIDKNEIDNRNKKSIAKIEASHSPSHQTNTELDNNQSSKKQGKNKRRSLNSRLQKSSRKNKDK